MSYQRRQASGAAEIEEVSAMIAANAVYSSHEAAMRIRLLTEISKSFSTLELVRLVAQGYRGAVRGSPAGG